MKKNVPRGERVPLPGPDEVAGKKIRPRACVDDKTFSFEIETRRFVQHSRASPTHPAWVGNVAIGSVPMPREQDSEFSLLGNRPTFVPERGRGPIAKREGGLAIIHMPLPMFGLARFGGPRSTVGSLPRRAGPFNDV